MIGEGFTVVAIPAFQDAYKLFKSLNFPLHKVFRHKGQILENQVVFRPLLKSGRKRSGVSESESGGGCCSGVFHTQVEYQNGGGSQHLFHAFSLFCYDSLSRTIFMPGQKKLFLRKRACICIYLYVKSPPGARGDFILVSRECKLFFRIVAKKRGS